MRVVELNVYPLKGARGIALERAEVLTGGLRHDRRFLLVDAEGAFVTQRSHPKLALITTALEGASLVLGSPGGASVRLLLAPEGPRRTVRIWDDEVEAVEVGGPAAALISDHLGQPCSLVFMPDDVVRPVEAPHGAAGDRVGFADAYPVLLATRASLDDLNARLASPVPMNRFRPNLVVEGGAPFEEERYGRVRVGSLTLRMPKRCSRCQVTTVDQDTAAVGKEPLRTLAGYRAQGNNVYFAQNAIPDGEGAIAVGDEVTYLDPLG
jgi:uncharacterized protein